MLPAAAGVPFVDGVDWTLALALAAKFYPLVATVLALGLLPRIEPVLWQGLSQSSLGLGWSNFIMGNWAPFLVTGCACQLLREARTLSGWTLFLVATAFAVAAHPGGVDFFRLTVTSAASAAMPVVVGLECLAVLSVALGWSRLPPSRALTWAGAVSYPLYLLHKEVGYRLIKGFAQVDPLLLLAAAAAAVLFLSSAVVYFEPSMQARPRHALRVRQASNINTGHSR